MRKSIEERLYGRSIRIYGTGCREFIGAKNRSGYGLIGYRGKLPIASRLSWSLANGREIPEGLVVRHSCDNPPCIEPAHLSLGTRQDNSDDMTSRGRSARGPRNANGRKTHCPQGHDYSEHGFLNNRGTRRCRPCVRVADQKQNDRRRGNRDKRAST